MIVDITPTLGDATSGAPVDATPQGINLDPAPAGSGLLVPVWLPYALIVAAAVLAIYAMSRGD